jgi:hypothetical protein
MSNTRRLRAGHHHSSVAKAGRCSTCRARNIEIVREGIFGFVLTFYDQAQASGERRPCACGCGKIVSTPLEREVSAIAVVRDWNGLDPVETAWATGCNAGTAVGVRAVPVDVIERTGVPLFTLLTPPVSTAALDALDAAWRTK